MNIFSPRSVMGMPPAIAIAAWHSLIEITGGVRKRSLNASSSAMRTRACVVRSSFSLGVKRLSPLTHCLSDDSKVGDEHLLATQCHGHAQSCHVPATSNLNCPSAITDGSLRHALLPPVVLPGRGVQTELLTRPSRLDPAFPLQRVLSGFRIVSQRKLWLHWVRRRSAETLRRCRLPFRWE